ncbi:MAG: hypothetical protein M3O09_09185 [Acidobacteriota bacterium]|nr:hypothetical protein [Acidobacteriota bacterium]
MKHLIVAAGGQSGSLRIVAAAKRDRITDRLRKIKPQRLWIDDQVYFRRHGFPETLKRDTG